MKWFQFQSDCRGHHIRNLQLHVQSVPITTKVVCSHSTHAGCTLCDKICQLLVTGQWFSPSTPVSSTNKTDCHDITEILLKVALKHHKPKPPNLSLTVKIQTNLFIYFIYSPCHHTTRKRE